MTMFSKWLRSDDTGFCAHLHQYCPYSHIREQTYQGRVVRVLRILPVHGGGSQLSGSPPGPTSNSSSRVIIFSARVLTFTPSYEPICRGPVSCVTSAASPLVPSDRGSSATGSRVALVQPTGPWATKHAEALRLPRVPKQQEPIRQATLPVRRSCLTSSRWTVWRCRCVSRVRSVEC